MKNPAYIMWILKNKFPKCLSRHIVEKYIPRINYESEIQYVHLELTYLSMLYRESSFYETFLQFCLRKQNKYISISDSKFKRKFYSRKKTVSEIVEQAELRKTYKKKIMRLF